MSRATNLARTTRDPNRAELATAITARDAAEREAQAASDALDTATARKREAERRRDALLPREGEGAEEGGNYGVAFAASLRAGRAVSAAELNSGRRERDAALEMGEAELAVWQRTASECETLSEQAQRTLDTACRAVGDAAWQVVRHSGLIEQKQAELASLYVQVEAAQAELAFSLGAFKPYGIEEVAARQKVECSLALARTVDCLSDHPNFARWRVLFEDLKVNGDAPLP